MEKWKNVTTGLPLCSTFLQDIQMTPNTRYGPSESCSSNCHFTQWWILSTKSLQASCCRRVHIWTTWTSCRDCTLYTLHWSVGLLKHLMFCSVQSHLLNNHQVVRKVEHWLYQNQSKGNTEWARFSEGSCWMIKKKQVLTDKNWAREKTAAYQCLQHFAFHMFISDNFLPA